MSNPKGNLSSLKPYKSKWNHGKTRTIRVPIVLADKIMEYARSLDKIKNQSLTQVNKPEDDEDIDDEELEEDDSDPTDSEVIRSQARKIQELILDVRYLERKIERLNSKDARGNMS